MCSSQTNGLSIHVQFIAVGHFALVVMDGVCLINIRHRAFTIAR